MTLATGPRPELSWIKSEVAVVVTVTAIAADPLSAIELGDTAQVDCDGAPVHAKVTDWLNPPFEVTVSG